ncbi:MAG: indole-3-glycerol phosphate synthase TrpC [Planctomycetota bacterium]
MAKTVLDEIVRKRRLSLAEEMAQVSISEVMRQAEQSPRPKDFRAALRARPGVSAIAEIKFASPSEGRIRDDGDPALIARSYAKGGAAALSILTETEHFQGKLAYLAAARSAVDIPLLRKDFIVDGYQLYQARLAGADAALLIVASLGAERLRELQDLARDLGLTALVEVHDEAELDIALSVGATLIGVNNRDLKTLKVDLGTSHRLAEKIPAEVTKVSESGIGSSADVERLAELGYDAMLVGTHFMKAADPGAALKALLEGSGKTRTEKS